MSTFPTDSHAIYERLMQFDPRGYTHTKNYLNAQSSFLGPYLTHGFLTLPMVLKALASRCKLSECYRFIHELLWREYWQRYLAKFGEKDLWKEKYVLRKGREGVFEELMTGETGILVLDESVRNLINNGYLSAQARKWYASFWTHLAKQDWRSGAKFFWYHLLDGDLASNAMNWQLVNGSFDDKPMIFTQENLNKFSGKEFEQQGTVLDKTMEDLFKEIAYAVEPIWKGARERGDINLKLDESVIRLSENPKEAIVDEIVARGQVIWIHEWMINEWLIEELDPEAKMARVLVIDEKFWNENPVSSKRLQFMIDLAKNIDGLKIYFGDAAELFKEASFKMGIGQSNLKVFTQEYFTDRFKEVVTSLRCSPRMDLQVLDFPWLCELRGVLPVKFDQYAKTVERVIL